MKTLIKIIAMTILITVFATLFALVESNCAATSKTKPALLGIREDESTGKEETEDEKGDGKGEEDVKVPEKKNALTSGPVKELPWSSDENFIKACSNYGTNFLLGAYKTVLRDPLPGEEYNVHLAADMLAGKVVWPGRAFSQNASIGPYTEDRGFREGPTYIGTRLTKTIGGGVCKIASTLYNVTVLSNLEIIERHAHSMPVPYVPYGQDATVAYGARDFKFRNNTGDAVLIWAKGIDNVLYMAFYGSSPAPSIEWRHQVLETRIAPTIFKINPKLNKGEQKIILEGMDGAVVKSWINITGPNGTVEKYMGVSDYQPMSNIVEKSE